MDGKRDTTDRTDFALAAAPIGSPDSYLFLARLRHLKLLHRLSREAFIAHCGLVDERRHDDGGLLEIVGLDVVQHVQVGVASVCLVVYLVLNKTHDRQAHLKEFD